MSRIFPRPWVHKLFIVWAGCSVLGMAAMSPVNAAGTTSGEGLLAGHLRISPSSGPPGTVVTVSGYVPEAAHMLPSERHTLSQAANVQFGGLSRGLNIETIRVHWSRLHPGDYSFRFRVPTQPWLTVTGELPLVAGRYPVTVTCVHPGFVGCGLGADASGHFTLTGPIRERRREAVLHFSPTSGPPGTLVHVTGWAPLPSVSRLPTRYQLTVNGSQSSLDVVHLTQAPNGSISGSFRAPTALMLGKTLGPAKIWIDLLYNFYRAQVPVTIAATPFRIERPRTWASLGSFQPQGVADNAAAGSFGVPFGIAFPMPYSIPSSVASDASQMVVSSVPGTLWIQRGAAWTPISTAPLAPLAATMGYPIAAYTSTQPIVTSTTLLQPYPQSLFIAVEANSSAHYRSIPPLFNIAFYSTNGGTSWQAVPVPHGFTAGDFGGYQSEGSTLAAYFTAGKRWTIEATGNGGTTWFNTSALTKPASGPAVRFGPMQNGSVPGLLNVQPILRENRRGHWVTTVTVNAQEGAVTLAAISSRESLLIRPNSAYPVEVSQNDGRDWTYVALPAIPGSGPYTDSQLVGMMANGDLVSEAVPLAGGTSAWFILNPGARAWARVLESLVPKKSVSAAINGASIEWLVSTGTSQAPPKVVSVSQQHL